MNDVQLMPDRSHYNAWPAVNLWFSEEDRREMKSAPKKTSDWFVGVFPEARGDSSNGLESSRVKF